MHNRTAGWLVAAALVVVSACGPAHATTEPSPAPDAPAVGETNFGDGAPGVLGASVEPTTTPGAVAHVAVRTTAVGDEDAAIVAAELAPADPRAGLPGDDPNGARCAGCPAVQPDPAKPVVSTAAGATPPVLSAVKTTDPVVFITIDDGEFWNEEAAVLLEQARLPITLFLTERFVADKQPAMQRLVSAGAFVESHTRTHPNLAVTAATEDEICGPLDRYQTPFGRRGTLFRPPYGNSTTAVQRVGASCGVRAVILWRASTNYGALATQGGALRAGDIILMHFRPDLADNLREVFRILDEQHLRVGRLECYVGGDERCGQPWRDTGGRPG